jgi:hypothetical protein
VKRSPASTVRIRRSAAPRVVLAVALSLGVSLSGCGSSDDGAVDQGEVTVLHGLTLGDRACYMEFRDAAGEPWQAAAGFELCEREELIGRRVRLTRERTTVLAAACQGDLDCPLRDTVDLIVRADAVPGSR